MGELGAGAEIAVLALGNLDCHRDRTIRRQLFGLADGHAREYAELPQAFGSLFQVLRRIGLPGVQARVVCNEAGIDRFRACHLDIADIRHRSAFGGNDHIHGRSLVIGNDAALGEFGQRPALFLQIDDDLFAGLDDQGRICPRPGRQVVVGGVAAGCIALEPHGAKGESWPRRNSDFDWNRRAIGEYRVGRQIIEALAVDPDIDRAAITGFFVEGCEQAIAVVARFDGKSEIAGYRLVLVLEKQRAVLQRLSQVFIFAAAVQCQRVVDGIDDLCRFLVLEEAHAENLEGMGLRCRKRAAQSHCCNRQGSASLPIRRT